jgi:hypothetical protein
MNLRDMKNDRHEALRESLWRRSLTAEEAAQLAAEPGTESREELALEWALTRALGKLPDAPLSSNFTARVLGEVEREQAASTRDVTAKQGWFGRRWLPRLAFGVVFFSIGLFSAHELHKARQAQITRSLVAVSQVRTLPSPDVLLNFDAVRALAPTPVPDEQLLTLLQ